MPTGSNRSPLGSLACDRTLHHIDLKSAQIAATRSRSYWAHFKPLDLAARIGQGANGEIRGRLQVGERASSLTKRACPSGEEAGKIPGSPVWTRDGSGAGEPDFGAAVSGYSETLTEST